MSDAIFNQDGTERKKNKDGSYRKTGSGRLKGSMSVCSTTLAFLVSRLPPDANLSVGTTWFKDAGLDQDSPPIQSTPIPIPVERPASPEPSIRDLVRSITLDYEENHNS